MGSTLSSFAAAAPESANATNVPQMDAVQQRRHLDAARSHLAAQRPSAALEEIIAIMRSAPGGERGLLEFMDRCKLAARQEQDRGNVSVEMVSALMRQLQLDAVDPYDDNDEHYFDGDDDDVAADAGGASFLEQQGKTAILRDAFHDGSSMVCVLCNSLVAAHRMKQHSELWCDALVE
jgi:hypothetical protein